MARPLPGRRDERAGTTGATHRRPRARDWPSRLREVTRAPRLPARHGLAGRLDRRHHHAGRLHHRHGRVLLARRRGWAAAGRRDHRPSSSGLVLKRAGYGVDGSKHGREPLTVLDRPRRRRASRTPKRRAASTGRSPWSRRRRSTRRPRSTPWRRSPRRAVKIIAEVKRASPSAATLADDPRPGRASPSRTSPAAPARSACSPRAAASAARSPTWRRCAPRSSLPVLRKDFIAEPYQVFEARAAGADLVLLIVAALDQDALAELHELVAELGMTALVETHSADEVDRAARRRRRAGRRQRPRPQHLRARPRPVRPLADRIPSGVIRVGGVGRARRRPTSRTTARPAPTSCSSARRS